MNKIESSNKTVEKHSKTLKEASFAQCIFILIQSLAFPGLGIIGAVIAAQCALMPWSIRIARDKPEAAIAMSISSALISPFFSLLCIAVIDTL